MYQVGGWLDWLRTNREPITVARPTRAVSPNVLFLGLTSLFTDISSEMVVSVLPVYLVGFLRMTPLQFGVVDGLYQGVAGLVQLASAGITDRIQRYKEVAAIGYAASALCRVGLLVTSGLTGITALLTIDRLGKGMRSAPRDALISLSVAPERLATAFGIHRAMDAVGAMLGPVVAFIILRAMPGAFDVVFVCSLSAAVIGFAVLGFFVQNRNPRVPASGLRQPPGVAAAFSLLRAPAFRHLALAALFLGAMTISDGFVYLGLQRRADISMGAFPLLYVLTSAGYLTFAMPAAWVADRFGRFPVYLAGHALLVVLYVVMLAMKPGLPLIGIAVLLLGMYYACTEGVLMAMGSALLPEELRTTGLAALTTFLAVARFGGSAIFGLCWSRFGLNVSVSIFAIGIAIGILAIGASRPTRASA